MPRQTLAIEVGSATLRVLRRVISGEQSVVFLHGGGGSSEDFEALIERFSDFDCLMIDSRGHGGSTMGDEPLNYPMLASDAEAVIKACKVSSPFIIGHSDGGIAALYIGARRKVDIKGLVVMAAQAHPPSEELIAKVFAPLTADQWRQRFPEWVRLYERLNPEPNFDRLFAALKAMWINKGEDNYPFRVLGRVDVPTLILCGDGDHLVPREQTLALAKHLPRAALGLFPFGSHVFHQEQPQVVMPFILSFIEEASK